MIVTAATSAFVMRVVTFTVPFSLATLAVVTATTTVGVFVFGVASASATAAFG